MLAVAGRRDRRRDATLAGVGSVGRRTGRDERDGRATLDALADVRGELARNNGLVAAVKEWARARLGRFADGLRSAGCGDDTAALQAANERLARVVRTGRPALEKVAADVRRVEDRLGRKRLEARGFEERAAATARKRLARTASGGCGQPSDRVARESSETATTGDATTGDATTGDATTGDVTAGEALNALNRRPFLNTHAVIRHTRQTSPSFARVAFDVFACVFITARRSRESSGAT